MKLIDLIEGKELPIKIRLKGWRSDQYNTVVHVTSALNCVCEDVSGKENFIRLGNDENEWELYVPPKGKRVLYETLIRSREGEFVVSQSLFENEDLAKRAWGSGYVRLLTERPIDVEL